jgi:hypothetical protein
VCRAPRLGHDVLPLLDAETFLRLWVRAARGNQRLEESAYWAKPEMRLCCVRLGRKAPEEMGRHMARHMGSLGLVGRLVYVPAKFGDSSARIYWVGIRMDLMHQLRAIAEHGDRGRKALGFGASEHHSEGIRAGGLAGQRFVTGDCAGSTLSFVLVGTPSPAAAWMSCAAGGEE